MCTPCCRLREKQSQVRQSSRLVSYRPHPRGVTSSEDSSHLSRSRPARTSRRTVWTARTLWRRDMFNMRTPHTRAGHSHWGCQGDCGQGPRSQRQKNTCPIWVVSQECPSFIWNDIKFWSGLLPSKITFSSLCHTKWRMDRLPASYLPIFLLVWQWQRSSTSRRLMVTVIDILMFIEIHCITNLPFIYIWSLEMLLNRVSLIHFDVNITRYLLWGSYIELNHCNLM